MNYRFMEVFIAGEGIALVREAGFIAIELDCFRADSLCIIRVMVQVYEVDFLWDNYGFIIWDFKAIHTEFNINWARRGLALNGAFFVWNEPYWRQRIGFDVRELNEITGFWRGHYRVRFVLWVCQLDCFALGKQSATMLLSGEAVG